MIIVYLEYGFGYSKCSWKFYVFNVGSTFDYGSYLSMEMSWVIILWFIWEIGAVG